MARCSRSLGRRNLWSKQNGPCGVTTGRPLTRTDHDPLGIVRAVQYRMACCGARRERALHIRETDCVPGHIRIEFRCAGSMFVSLIGWGFALSQVLPQTLMQTKRIIFPVRDDGTIRSGAAIASALAATNVLTTISFNYADIVPDRFLTDYGNSCFVATVAKTFNESDSQPQLSLKRFRSCRRCPARPRRACGRHWQPQWYSTLWCTERR
jgi:hypothetical protein